MLRVIIEVAVFRVPGTDIFVVFAHFLLARAELHKVHSSSARLAEAGGGSLPLKHSHLFDLSDDVVNLGAAALVTIV